MKKLSIALILISLAILIILFMIKFNNENQNTILVNNYIKETTIDSNTADVLSGEPIQDNKKNNYTINYTAVLEIPSISLKRGVVDSTKNFKSINYAISVDKNSNYPNENGNFILYAHSGNSNIAFFRNLTKVNINDDVYIFYNGIKYHYVIFDKYDIQKTGKAKVIASNVKNYITLITCNQKRNGYQTVLVGELTESKEY